MSDCFLNSRQNIIISKATRKTGSKEKPPSAMHLYTKNPSKIIRIR